MDEPSGTRMSHQGRQLRQGVTTGISRADHEDNRCICHKAHSPYLFAEGVHLTLDRVLRQNDGVDRILARSGAMSVDSVASELRDDDSNGRSLRLHDAFPAGSDDQGATHRTSHRASHGCY